MSKKLTILGKGRLSRYTVKLVDEHTKACITIRMLSEGVDDVCLAFLSETDRATVADMLAEKCLVKHRVDLKDRGLLGTLGIDDDSFEYVHTQLESIDIIKKFSRDEGGESFAQCEWCFNFTKDMDTKDNALNEAFLNHKEEMQVQSGKNRDGSPKMVTKKMFVQFNFKYVQSN